MAMMRLAALAAFDCTLLPLIREAYPRGSSAMPEILTALFLLAVFGQESALRCERPVMTDHDWHPVVGDEFWKRFKIERLFSSVI